MSAGLGIPDALRTALLLVAAMSVAGAIHVVWLKSAASKRFAQPLDGGLRWGAARLLGPNKQLRGLLAMPFACAATFALLGVARHADPAGFAASLWDLRVAGYAGLGFCAVLGFMLAELPNSFFKRRLGVAPGDAPRQRWLRPACFIVDRLDSTLGALTVVSLAVPLAGATWLWALALGPLPHAAFSAWLHHAGEKARAL